MLENTRYQRNWVLTAPNVCTDDAANAVGRARVDLPQVEEIRRNVKGLAAKYKAYGRDRGTRNWREVIVRRGGGVCGERKIDTHVKNPEPMVAEASWDPGIALYTWATVVASPRTWFQRHIQNGFGDE